MLRYDRNFREVVTRSGGAVLAPPTTRPFIITPELPTQIIMRDPSPPGGPVKSPVFDPPLPPMGPGSPRLPPSLSPERSGAPTAGTAERGGDVFVAEPAPSAAVAASRTTDPAPSSARPASLPTKGATAATQQLVAPGPGPAGPEDVVETVPASANPASLLPKSAGSGSKLLMFGLLGVGLLFVFGRKKQGSLSGYRRKKAHRSRRRR